MNFGAHNAVGVVRPVTGEGESEGLHGLIKLLRENEVKEDYRKGYLLSPGSAPLIFTTFRLLGT